MTPCQFRFMDSPPIAGYAYGTTWNGFDNIAVTLATAHEIDRYFEVVCALEGWPNEDEPLADMEPDARGLISLAYGYATEIVP